MPTYTVKIKGRAHSCDSDLTDNEAIIRLRKLVKKGLVKGPFAPSLLREATEGRLTPGWYKWIHMLATSKKARQEFGSDKREEQESADSLEQRKIASTTRHLEREAARALQAVFGRSGAVQAVLGSTAGAFAGKWRGILLALEALPDPRAAKSGKRIVLIED